jgi:hypothetical protein
LAKRRKKRVEITPATLAEFKRIGQMLHGNHTPPNRREYKAHVNLATGAQNGRVLQSCDWQELTSLAFPDAIQKQEPALRKPTAKTIKRAIRLAYEQQMPYAGLMWSPHEEAGIALCYLSAIELCLKTHDGVCVIEPIDPQAAIDIVVVSWEPVQPFKPTLLKL